MHSMTEIFEMLLFPFTGLMLLVVARCCYSEAMDTWAEWRRGR
jgi:hypothetical protein